MNIRESELNKHEFILKLIGYCLEQGDKNMLDFIENEYIKGKYGIYREIVDYEDNYHNKELGEKKQLGDKWFSKKDKICKNKISEYKAQITKGEDSFNDYFRSESDNQLHSLEPSSWLED